MTITYEKIVSFEYMGWKVRIWINDSDHLGDQFYLDVKMRATNFFYHNFGKSAKNKAEAILINDSFINAIEITNPEDHDDLGVVLYRDWP